MKKAIIVEYNFMTRIVIDEKDENLEYIVNATKQKILDKINNDELSDNLSEWYDDTECPHEEEVDVRQRAISWWNELKDNPLLRIIKQGELTKKYHGQMRKANTLTGREIEDIYISEN